MTKREWRCPRCVHRCHKEDRFCWFCGWDAEAPRQAPDEWDDTIDPEDGVISVEVKTT